MKNTSDNSSFGKLFYNEELYADANLLRQALYEIADYVGHSIENPISLSLLCLQLLIPYNVAIQIYHELLKLIRTNNVKEIQIDDLRNIMIIHYPQAHDFQEIMVLSFFKAMVRCLMPPSDDEALIIGAMLAYLELDLIESKRPDK